MDAYIYQYSIGGFLFLLGSIFAWRQGYMGLSGRPLRNLCLAFIGFAGFMLFQGYLQYAPMQVAPKLPYNGSYTPSPRLGTNLDYGIMVGYFVLILAVGTWFGRGQGGTRDFFFGGQRFAWWLIAFSLIATTIGSYSFVKYSHVAFTYGIGSSQTYLNDWFWMPFLLFGWLPILYFSRVTSIPEYFLRRFDVRCRRIVTWLLLLYLIGYVGVNLYTMGKALHHLLGWEVMVGAAIVASISAVYVTIGGQTSVIMTDLLQGVMLLATGLLILYLGAEHLGGAEELWTNLPRSHRRAFPNFNEDPAYHSVGIFWQDAIANTGMFYFLNQGLAMRFMATRSVRDARKATIAVVVVLMPLAAAVVASGGWVGRALEHHGELPSNIESAKVFFVTAELLAKPGVFGLIMATLTAALMSTVDTLITAVAAIIVNDVYAPRHPESSDTQKLRIARYASIGVTVLGVALVPFFDMFDSIQAAHGAFTAAVTPPLLVTLLLGVFWRRYTATAAFWTMAGGSAALALSIVFPQLIVPFAQGAVQVEVGDSLLAGARQFKYMRALFGLSVSAFIGVAMTLVTPRPDKDSLKGLVWGTVADAIAHYKGSPGTEQEGPWAKAHMKAMRTDEFRGEANLPLVRISACLAEELGGAGPGDLLYVTDPRAWLGGLRSTHTMLDAILPDTDGSTIELGPSGVALFRKDLHVKVKKLY